MLGTVLFIDEATGAAVVRADDGKRYRFETRDWPVAAPLAVGTRVDFDPDGDRAVGPLPVSDELAKALGAPPPDAPAKPVEPMVAAPVASEPAAAAVPTFDGESTANATQPFASRALSAADAPATDFPSLSEPADPTGRSGMSALVIIGGAVVLLALAALAYMMWDNAAGTDDRAELSESVTLYAQEDLPVRNVASMTNSTVLGRIQRGDRVTGIEVPGASDESSRWLQLDGGARFVPMTGLGPTAPPPQTEPAPLPAPGFSPPVPPADGALDGRPSDPGATSDRPTQIPAPPAIRPAPPPRPAPAPEPADGPRDPRDTPPVGGY